MLFQNEILLILSIPLIFGAVLVAYRLFGKVGLFAMTPIATILANIEVLMLVDGFGMEQTLGNVMFAATFLITDILSENEGKKAASVAVWLGVLASAIMLVMTQYWLLYIPSDNDWARPAITQIFSTTPRLMLGSFLGYIISQRFDVWLYHLLWQATSKKTGDTRKFLWLRNNAATLISQIVNTVLFTLIAFGGMYDTPTLLGVMLSSYVIYVFTSLADTPALYLARRMKEKHKVKEHDR